MKIKPVLQSAGIMAMTAALVLSSSIHAEEFINVQNAAVSADFSINHSVPRESYFKTIVKTAKINEDALKETNLGEFRVRNNTRDGFQLTLQTLNGGVLASETSEDGEVDIPYTVNLSKSGEVGAGIDSDMSFASGDMAAALVSGVPLNILNKAGTIVTSATDARFQLNIKIEDNTDSLGMAGTYADVITLTYTDL
jgi:hypothetical protein